MNTDPAIIGRLSIRNFLAIGPSFPEIGPKMWSKFGKKSPISALFQEKTGKKPEKTGKPDPVSTVSCSKVVLGLYYGVWKKIQLPTWLPVGSR